MSGTVALVYLSDMITLSVATGGAYTEITAGDGILLNDQKHTLKAKTSDTVWQLDSVFMGTSDGTGLAYKFVQTIQNPQGDDEGHFYMECANRGICDRKAGACKTAPVLLASAPCVPTIAVVTVLVTSFPSWRLSILLLWLRARCMPAFRARTLSPPSRIAPL